MFEADKGRAGEVVVLRPKLVILAGTCFFFLRFRGGTADGRSGVARARIGADDISVGFGPDAGLRPMPDEGSRDDPVSNDTGGALPEPLTC